MRISYMGYYLSSKCPYSISVMLEHGGLVEGLRSAWLIFIVYTQITCRLDLIYLTSLLSKTMLKSRKLHCRFST